MTEEDKKLIEQLREEMRQLLHYNMMYLNTAGSVANSIKELCIGSFESQYLINKIFNSVYDTYKNLDKLNALTEDSIDELK